MPLAAPATGTFVQGPPMRRSSRAQLRPHGSGESWGPTLVVAQREKVWRSSERSSHMHSQPRYRESQEIPRPEGPEHQPGAAGRKAPEVGTWRGPQTPVLPEALHPHPLISLILVFIQRSFYMSIQPAKAMSSHRNEVKQSPSNACKFFGCFTQCYSGRFMTQGTIRCRDCTSRKPWVPLRACLEECPRYRRLPDVLEKLGKLRSTGRPTTQSQLAKADLEAAGNHTVSNHGLFWPQLPRGHFPAPNMAPFRSWASKPST